MNRIKLLAAVVGGLSVGQALAVTAHTFVDNSGDADITLPGNWNPAVADGAWTTDEFRFLPGFDYKMGSSLTLGQVQMNTAGRRVFPAGTLATLSSALPPKCKLVIKNNNELWLKAPGQGLMILLR